MPITQELDNLKHELTLLVRGKVISKDLSERVVLDYNRLVSCINSLRILNQRNVIVMTIGSFDLFHTGHARYLAKAKGQGTHLIVGIDSDSAIRRYKGPTRPIIPAIERLELLAGQKSVDFVTIIDDVDAKGTWYYGLLRVIRPDIFVAVEDSYPEEQKIEIKAFCKKLVILPRQAERTSSTIIIQKVIKADPKLLEKLLRESKRRRLERQNGKK